MHMTTVYKTDCQGVKRNYYRLCESYRTSLGQPRKRMLCALGYLDELPELKQRVILVKCIEDLAYRSQRPMSGDDVIDRLTYHYYERIVSNGKLSEIKGLMEEYHRELERRGIEKVNLSTLKNIDPREIGAEHICASTLRRLGVSEFLQSKGWDAEDTRFALLQIASRAIYPVSELKTASFLRENSGLCELMGVNPLSVNHHRLYQSAHRLYELHESLEDHLHERVCSLFDLKDEVLLFDLSNTYFEGRMQGSKLARFGRSKEKRSDCRLVVLAAVVNAQGMLVRTRIFEGNRSDCSTLKEIIDSLVNEQIRRGKSKDEITVVMDAGISTRENIKYLKENHYRFITVAHSSGLKYRSAGQGVQQVEDNKKQVIRLEKVLVEGSQDTFLLVDSNAKTLKERSMYERSCQYFEEGLAAIANGIQKKGGTKKLDKVCERLGRLKAECPAVWKDYSIGYTHNEKNIVTSFNWKHEPERSLCRESKHGKYVLYTNLDESDEKNIWNFYNVIREVEATFRCLKTDLDIRPVYHKSDDGAKAHLNLAVLAYWIVSTTRYQLKQVGIHHLWSEIIRIVHTHKLVSTKVEKEDGTLVEIRQCTEPNERVQEIYQVLNIAAEPIRRRKFVVHPEQPPNKKNRLVRPREGG